MSGRRGRGGGSRPTFVTSGSGLVGKVAKNLALNTDEAIGTISKTATSAIDNEDQFDNLPDISMPTRKPASSIDENAIPEEEEVVSSDMKVSNKSNMITLTGPAVIWSSDEEDEDGTAPAGRVDQEIGDIIITPNANVSDLADIEEEDEVEIEKGTVPTIKPTEMLVGNQIGEVNLSPLTAAEEKPAISFEAALSMLSSRPKKVKQSNQSSKAMISLLSESGDKTINTVQSNDEDEVDDEIETHSKWAMDPDEEMDRTIEIEIGDLRELDEDERIIIPRPKEESTVEASGEDESHDSDVSDESRSATVQGVKVKYKSNAQIPPLMVEEAEIAALDKLEVVTSPLPPMKPEKEGEISETEIRLKQLPNPPDLTAMTDQKWDWEEQQPRQQEMEDLSKRDIDMESIISDAATVQPKPRPKSGLRDLQASVGNELLEAFNEEEFLQQELKDIRAMKKKKMLEEHIPMSQQQKVNTNSRSILITTTILG